MKFTAAGDVLCQRRMAEDYDGFRQVKEFIERGDARFFNLETTVNREGECYGNQFSGGTYIRCNPEVMRDVLKLGFNMTSFNNNHLMDFAHEGIFKTLEYVGETGIVHAGVGRNLHEASAPAYLDTKNGKVALVAVNTTFNPAIMAGEQSRRLPGRPGGNGITVTKRVVLPAEELEHIKRIGDACGINISKNIVRAEGYYPPLPDGMAELDELQFKLGDKPDIDYQPSAADVARAHAAIREARLKADYVMVSIHSHQLYGPDKETVPAFLTELCRGFIDAGADAVVGHGPHLLRAMEVYREKPIFYCLGDFLIQLYDVEVAPEDFYKKYGMNSDASVIELLQKRSANFTRGLMEDDRMLETVIPYWETDGEGKLTHLELMPVKASKGEGKMLEGLPRPAKDTAFMKKLAAMSKPYGVDVVEENGKWICKW
ncbi:MAG: CapA family protein [Clostridia bacterium]|nr:CapA family protein [Clostridia bacterium]